MDFKVGFKKHLKSSNRTGDVEIRARECLEDCVAEEKITIEHPTRINGILSEYGHNNCSSSEDGTSYDRIKVGQKEYTTRFWNLPAINRFTPKFHILGASLAMV
jgi:hypothetical protein